MNTDKPPKKYKPGEKYPGNARDDKSELPFVADMLLGAYSYSTNNR